MMFANMFNHINLIGKSLDASWLRQEIISQNIANVDTPKYKSRRVEFETMFRNALQNENSFETKTTRSRHIKALTGDPLATRPVIITDTHYSMRMDENNVDIDQEMTRLSKNTILYNQLVNKANMEFNRLRIAITGNR